MCRKLESVTIEVLLAHECWPSTKFVKSHHVPGRHEHAEGKSDQAMEQKLRHEDVEFYYLLAYGTFMSSTLESHGPLPQYQTGNST